MSKIHANERSPTPWATLGSAAAIFVCLFGNLGAIGLVGPDEPRYVWIARAMAETGDWVTPRLYGQPWFEKPALYYWTAAAGFLLHLPAEWAGRLPSAFAALAATLTIGWLARKHYGGESTSLSSPTLLAPLLFSTTVAAIGFARAATPDMLFSAFLTLAMASAACVLRYRGALRAADSLSGASARDTWPLLLFGAFLGLAVLAKGPAAILLAAGAMGLWALATKQWRAAFRVLHPLAVVAFSIVALPWYALCLVRNPDFVRVFLWQHNFERYVSPIFQHRQPFWFFGPIVLLALLPWTVLLWPAAQEGLRIWRERLRGPSPGFFFGCWAVVPVLFFSLSQSKLPGYILPAIPPLALLCSVALPRAFQRNRATAAVLAASLGATWIAVASIGLHALRRFAWDAILTDQGPRNLAMLGDSALGFAILIAIALILAGYRTRLELVVGLCALSAVLSVEVVSVRILPLLDFFYSARPHAAFLRNDQRPDRIFAYRLSRSWDFGLAFYFRRELPEWSPDDPRPALVLTTAAGLDQIKKLGRFNGELEEAQPGLVYVPIAPVPSSR